jgi:14-3-3 protein epsilon
MAEYSVDTAKKEASDKALAAYNTAFTVANELPPTNPIRLCLALNFSVFHYEILNNPEQVCNVILFFFYVIILRHVQWLSKHLMMQ